MRIYSLVGSLLVAVLLVSAGEIPKPAVSVAIPTGAALELLFTRSEDTGGSLEGPAVAPDGSIYFSDIPFGKNLGRILRFDPKTKETTVFAKDSRKSNGLVFDSEGRMIACEGADFGGRQISRWDIKTGKRSTIVDNYMGKKFNSPNDLCLDRKGRIYFSDPRYVGHESRELTRQAVYRLDNDGSLIEITHEVAKPNGIVLSPDERTLYVGDHDNGADRTDPGATPPSPGTMRVYAFPLGSDGKISGRRRTVIDFGNEKGVDGITVDRQGNLYLTAHRQTAPGVIIVDPNGKEIGFIPTSSKHQKGDDPKSPLFGLPTNLEFGIAGEADMLYITVDVRLYRIRLKTKGYHVQYPN